MVSKNTKMRILLSGSHGLLLFLIASTAAAQSFTWAGMRNPCKQSAEDGLNEQQLARKIGTFILLPSKQAWSRAIFNVQNRFPNSRPWATWGVGDVRDAEPLTDLQHEEYLTHMDELGVAIFLELAPNRDADVPALIGEWLEKLKHHPSVQGLGIDLEFYKPVDDATARAWDEKIKAVNSTYRLFFKHWEVRFMPSTYRGNGDVIFINTSSEASIEALNTEYAAWARHFAPNAVAFQIGYPADEDGMDGDTNKGWWRLDDPIKDWGNSLLSQLDDTDQQIGLLWVCVKSGKSYNAGWDLTTNAKIPSKK
jgi:hypothetical protein